MSRVPTLRRRLLSKAGTRSDGDYVLYWMTAARRLHWNHALDRAVEHALEMQKPLVVLEPVNVDYPWASDRHHRAILDGMAVHDRTLDSSAVGHYPYVEPAPGAGAGLLDAVAAPAAVVVTDDSPTFFTPRLLAAAACLPVRVEAVDSCGLLPIAATDRVFGAAYHFRRFLQKELPAYLGDAPRPEPLAEVSLPVAPDLPSEITRRWPRVPTGSFDDGALLASLPIDHSVGPTGWIGGSETGSARVTSFVAERLDRYGERNHPDADVVSGLSPWLHYGHVSPHEVFHGVVRWEGWSPARVTPPNDGRRNGWWGMSEPAEAFLDQLVTWRELGFGFAARTPEYGRYESLPLWARQTLEDHASDPREHTYSLAEFAASRTHDELWNAAQRQLVESGTIHNYLRMLWGKKILEWTEHPREALDVMIELNNRYALDGRDPNSYSGIFWTLGRFDRGWPERPIYGKVRSMTSRSTRRKVDLDRYLSRWGAQADLGTLTG